MLKYKTRFTFFFNFTGATYSPMYRLFTVHKSQNQSQKTTSNFKYSTQTSMFYSNRVSNVLLENYWFLLWYVTVWRSQPEWTGAQMKTLWPNHCLVLDEVLSGQICSIMVSSNCSISPFDLDHAIESMQQELNSLRLVTETGQSVSVLLSEKVESVYPHMTCSHFSVK